MEKILIGSLKTTFVKMKTSSYDLLKVEYNPDINAIEVSVEYHEPARGTIRADKSESFIAVSELDTVEIWDCILRFVNDKDFLFKKYSKPETEFEWHLIMNHEHPFHKGLDYASFIASLSRFERVKS